jgi:hypothetical protein
MDEDTERMLDRMTNRVTLTDGSPVTPDHKTIDPATGMQKGYKVLSEKERARGFVRPVRRTYRHVGIRPKYPLRDLTDNEKETYASVGYVKYEAYLDSESPLVGRFWTQAQLNSGCRGETTMGVALAETYAADPKFYGGAFCAHCRTHFDNEEFVWAGTSEILGS